MLAYLDENQKKRQKLILTLLTRNPLMMDDLLQKESEEVTYMAHIKDVNSQHMKESQISHILPAPILVILIERYLKQKNESRLQIV